MSGSARRVSKPAKGIFEGDGGWFYEVRSSPENNVSYFGIRSEMWIPTILQDGLGRVVNAGNELGNCLIRWRLLIFITGI